MTLAQEAMSIIERMPRRDQQVVLDLLRVMSGRSAVEAQTEEHADTNMVSAVLAAQELAGLWKDHENELSAEEMVREMRKGRVFDT